MADAARRWADALASWAIPERILADAPQSPWGCPVGLFARRADEPPTSTPSRERAVEALPPRGSVLDIGAGAGAASLATAPPAARVVAVDEDEAMLEAFAARAAERGLSYDCVLGRWPDVAAGVEPVDVVVCHHVFYNVADLAPFVRALSEHARRRVVVELTERHPQSDLNELWRALHGVERPSRPTAADAVDVVRETGVDVHVERFVRASGWTHASDPGRVEFARRRLCVGPERDAEIERMLGGAEGRALVTLWWDAV